MVQTFLPWSTKTGFWPPAMHFLTQSAPLPACRAPQVESEIQPLILFESAALAARPIRANVARTKTGTRFTGNLQGNGESRTGTIMRVPLPVRQGNKVIALSLLKLRPENFYLAD
jgi:hypothetical protein